MGLLPPSPRALSRSNVRFSGVRFSLAFPSGAPDNGLVFALSDFSLKSSQVPPKTGELSFPGRFLVHFDFQVPSGSRTHSKQERRPRQNRPPPPSPCYGLSAFLSPCEGRVDTGPQTTIQSRTGPPGSSLTPNPKALSHGQAEWLVWTPCRWAWLQDTHLPHSSVLMSQDAFHPHSNSQWNALLLTVPLSTSPRPLLPARCSRTKISEKNQLDFQTRTSTCLEGSRG